MKASTTRTGGAFLETLVGQKRLLYFRRRLPCLSSPWLNSGRCWTVSEVIQRHGEAREQSGRERVLEQLHQMGTRDATVKVLVLLFIVQSWRSLYSMNSTMLS